MSETQLPDGEIEIHRETIEHGGETVTIIATVDEADREGK